MSVGWSVWCLLSLVIDEVELPAALRGKIQRPGAAEAVTDREQATGELINPRDGAAGVGADHAGEGELALGVDGVGALVGGDAAEAHGIFAAGQLDLHFIEHHLRRLLAIELGVDGLPAAF